MAVNYPAFNPFQQNFAPAYQMPPQMPQQSVQQPSVSQNIPAVPNAPVMRFVASKAEVIAAQIPFDGSTYYFLDTSNGKIYAKTFNFNDGTAPIVTYSREVEQQIQYATLEDINALRAEIEALKPKKAVKKNDAEE